MKNTLISICLISLLGCSNQSSEGQHCQIDSDCLSEFICEDEVCQKQDQVEVPTTSSTSENTTTEISTSDEPTTSLGSSSTTIEYDLPMPMVPNTCDPNGVLEYFEECDDLIELNCHNCWKDRYIFVTSFPITGMPFPYNVCNLAGQLGIDENLNFKPLLHYNDSSLNDVVGSYSRRYILTTGDIFAEKFENIINDDVLNAPSFDEYGNFQSVNVWTGNATWNCGDWSYLTHSSILGKSDDVNLWWNAGTGRNDVGECLDSYHLYCIEDY